MVTQEEFDDIIKLYIHWNKYIRYKNKKLISKIKMLESLVQKLKKELHLRKFGNKPIYP